MPDSTTSHPGSWIGDLANEWKTAKTPEKVMIVGAIVAVIGIALYLHGKSSAAPNQPGASGLAGIPANFQQGGGGSGGPGSTGGPSGGTNAPSGPIAPPTNNPPKSSPTPTGTPLPQKPNPMYPVRPIIQQPTTITKVAASTNHAPSAPAVRNVQGVSPAYARVQAQRTGILQYRTGTPYASPYRQQAQAADVRQARLDQIINQSPASSGPVFSRKYY